MESKPPPDPPAQGPPTLQYERTPQYVPVARFADSAEAAMAASNLAGHAIDFDVVEDATRHGLGQRGATLVVVEEDLSRAVEVLSATPARRCLLVTPVSPPSEGQPRPAGLLLRWLRLIDKSSTPSVAQLGRRHLKPSRAVSWAARGWPKLA
jgi:hypothetical protein